MANDNQTLGNLYVESLLNEGIENEALFDQLKDLLAKGARFASFIYKTNGTGGPKNPNGPTSLYTVNFGIDYGNFKEHNRKVYAAYEPKDEWEVIAKEQLLGTASETEEEKPEKDSVYVQLSKGIRYNTQKDVLNILGQVSHREQVAAGEEKVKAPYDQLAVNKDGTPRGGDKAHIARAKRMIAHELKNDLRKALVSYDLDPEKIAGLKLNGDVIEFQSEGNAPLN